MLSCVVPSRLPHAFLTPLCDAKTLTVTNSKGRLTEITVLFQIGHIYKRRGHMKGLGVYARVLYRKFP
jgi:hypothetical protein